jgi:hypothetical protein
MNAQGTFFISLISSSFEGHFLELSLKQLASREQTDLDLLLNMSSTF